MRFALEVLDEMIGEAMAWAEANPELVIVYASSMGQHAVRYDNHEGVEFIVDDLDRLMAAAGAGTGQFTRLLAMVPQVAVDIANAKLRAILRASLEAATTLDGQRFIVVQEQGNSLSITVNTPRRAAIDLGACKIAGRRVTWQELGMRAQAVEPGSAYHIPEGSFAFFGQRIIPTVRAGRPLVRTDQVKEWLLRISEKGAGEVHRFPAVEAPAPRELQST